MWLFFALLTPLFWSVVHVMDSHCVEEIFDSPWMGFTTSALSSLIVFIPLPLIAPFIEWEAVPSQVILYSLFVGLMIQVSQAFYFKALSYTEAGIIAAYWNLTPALLPIISLIIVGTTLSISKYFGIFVIITGSVGLCLIDTNAKARLTPFLLMLIASLLQVFLFLLEDYIFTQIPFIQGFYLITVGLIITGVSPLILPAARNAFKLNMNKLAPAAPIFIGIETANLLALFTSQKAVYLGIPSLVAAVESTIPAYAFLLGILLWYTYPRWSNKRVFHKLKTKFAFVGLMSVGVLLVS